MLVIYTKLIISALIPVALSFLFYFLTRKTSFGKLPYAPVQIIIGIFFGAAAIFGTEYGVDVGGATANARDAAPLCAGLIFGAPAGIIAGIIGGVERWFAVLWGAGLYSRVACSVSTVLAGIYAALLRKYMFDNKRPTWGFGLAIAVVMEVVHMTILFLTHLQDAPQAIEIVKICTMPMISCNGFAVMFSIILISVSSHKNHTGEKRIKKISQQVQSWLLLCIVTAYFATTLFVYIFQTNTALIQTGNLLELNLRDAKSEFQNVSDEGQLDLKLLKTTHNIAEEYEYTENPIISELSEKYGVSEINLVDENGIIKDSTISDFIGFDMRSGEQSSEFMKIVDRNDCFEMVQKFQTITKNSRSYRKYAAVKLTSGGFIQVGYNYDKFNNDIVDNVRKVVKNRHVGESGYLMICKSNAQTVKTPSGSILDVAAMKKDSKQNTTISVNVGNEDMHCMYIAPKGFLIIALIPQKETFSMRDTATFVNSFMEVLVFALLFALIYFLIKRLVVNNIRLVNDSLSEIIGGNLDVTVDVHSSDEFSSLSDDINSTVSTLKHYIGEAAARIDKELAFAKNIQHSALPSVFPPYPNIHEFDIYATMDTAKEVGGDFYDFYMLGENKLAFLIADVSGKGIGAAMFMMTSKTMIKNLAETGMEIGDIMTIANKKLCEGNEAGMFVTAWMGILDITTGVVKYVCAGHNPPIIYRKGKGFEYLKTRSGFVLAGMEGVKYRAQEITLSPGDSIFLYTDGATEATRADKELYGEERLIEYLKKHENDDLKEILTGIKADIDKFAGDAEQFDDITMLMVNYRGNDSGVKEKEFPATVDSLSDATAFVSQEMEKNGVPMKISMQILVALEEIFVNVAHYAYSEQGGAVKVAISINSGKITISFKDTGTPFDPLKKDDPDISLSAEERSIGGLGIFMVKKSMDDVYYRYSDGMNILTIVKKF